MGSMTPDPSEREHRAEIEPFRYQDRDVRALLVDGEPWFIAADVCDILGYSRINNALRMLDDDDLATHLVRGDDGRERPGQIVSEPGLYVLILRSDRPEARKFRKWVTRDVLPQIRRTGSYAAVPAQRPAELSRLDLIEIARAAELERLALAEKVAELEPKAAAADALMNTDGALKIGAVANMLGVGRNTLFKMLYDERILMRDRRPYQQYAAWFRVVATTHEATTGQEFVDYTAYLLPSGAVRLHALLTRRGYTLRRPTVSGGQLVLIDGSAS